MATRLFETVVSGEGAVPPAPAESLLMQGKITRLGRGSEAMRFLWGAYGAGQTRAQAEMFLVDARSGEVMVATADRRLSRAGGGDKFWLKEAFDDMARDLGKFLLRLSEGKAPGR